MNYLAHLFLSGRNPEIIIGNMMEDFITGNIDHPRNAHLTPLMKIGVKMHREIDTLMDSHALIRECKTYFYDRFGKYSPIITDVLCDHFVVKHWEEFRQEPFDEFRTRVYASLMVYREKQPEAMRFMIDSMIKYDWLKNYSEIWGLERAFVNLNKKINRPEVDLTTCLPVFQDHYEVLGDHFVAFIRIADIHFSDFLKLHYPDGQ